MEVDKSTPNWSFLSAYFGQIFQLGVYNLQDVQNT